MAIEDNKEELQITIQTIDFTPAIVKFNAEQISALLDLQLAKYQGLTFTEDSEKQAKTVIAELNKGKKMLDTYRKDTKAKLTASVTDFEDEIKKLSAKFDAVIGPLTEQTAKFEVDRKFKKRTDIESLIAALLIEHDLSEQFAAKLIYPEEYLNRTLSIKSITFDLQALAEQLRADQDRLANELQLIRGSVELANQAIPGFGFLDTTYTRLLGPLNLSQVLARINEDVIAVKERNAQAEAREVQRLAALETQRLADLETQRSADEARAAYVAPVIQPTPAPTPIPEVKYMPPSIIMPKVAPTAPLAERFVEIYKVTGTQEQLDSVEAFFKQNNLPYTIIED